MAKQRLAVFGTFYSFFQPWRFPLGPVSLTVLTVLMGSQYTN